MEDNKSIFLSVTFWGIIVSVASKLLALAGWEVPVEGLDILIAGLVGDAFAFWGRIRATKKIGAKEEVAPVEVVDTPK
jgi:hypothetical protein